MLVAIIIAEIIIAIGISIFIIRYYHNNSWHTTGTLFCKNPKFQLKLFANNGTKFGAPRNRAPLKIIISLYFYYSL